MALKKTIKDALMYRGLRETDRLREVIHARYRKGWPYCPQDEGDLLFLLAQSPTARDSLQVGFATGSTAAYILSGLTSGRLTSIDYAQDEYEREGVALLHELGLDANHELIEENSVIALPRLHESGRRLDLVFMDGWKTFDHIWVDTFFCARMLNVGGHIVFDDARMPAVRKCISILIRYYEFQLVDTYKRVGGWRQRLWHLLTTRSFLPPYIALQKVREISETEAGRRFDYWKPF